MIFKKFIILFLLAAVFSACDNYKKVQQSTNYDYKYEMAVKYYEKKEYERASELFKELLVAFRGTSKTEKIFYYWVYCDFYMEDYLTAAYEFRRFIQSFPVSEYAEEMQYMAGVCYTKYSPAYNLDQEYTVKAIDEFQLFLEKYPKGKYSEAANKSVDELQYKLEKKAFETARLYYKIGEYRSSVVSGDNFCREFPDSKHTEEMRYMMVLASFDYAEKSIEEKQIERFRQVPVYVDKFVKSHPKSDKLAELEKVKQKSLFKIKILTYKLPVYYFGKADYVEANKGFDQLLASAEFTDKTNEIIYYKLKGQYLHSWTVEPDKRGAELTKFRTLFETYKSNEAFVKTEFYKELEIKYNSSEKTIAKLPLTIGDEYYNLLNFEKAAKYYYSYAGSDIDPNIKSKFLVKGLDAELKFAEKSPVIGRYEKYKKAIEGFEDKKSVIKGSVYESKALNLLTLAQKKMDAHPLSLFKEQFKNKQYDWVKSQAQKYLLDNKMGKYQDEIVYLWAVSEFKLAKKSERYERIAQCQKALEQIQEIEKLNFNNQLILQDIQKVESRVKTKIEQLTKRSHGLQKN
ncbi:MAG: outer membrane protein assembly factor BamD [Bacteroidetes bacterium]|nr:outer membrane protein assembly factor BamD [Bacteroidota bacterium]